jgi:hypothetical protein
MFMPVSGLDAKDLLIEWNNGRRSSLLSLLVPDYTLALRSMWVR